MTTTVDVRKDLYAFAMQGKENSPAISGRASEKIDAFRAAVLHETADRYQGILDNVPDPTADPRYWTGVRDMIAGLRNIAAEEPQDEEA